MELPWEDGLFGGDDEPGSSLAPWLDQFVPGSSGFTRDSTAIGHGCGPEVKEPKLPAQWPQWAVPDEAVPLPTGYEPPPSRNEDVEFEATTYIHKRRRRSRSAEAHNRSERKRRARINKKIKALHDLIPRSNKAANKASALDDVFEYVKTLQQQVQMMSMGCGMVPMMHHHHRMTPLRPRGFAPMDHLLTGPLLSQFFGAHYCPMYQPPLYQNIDAYPPCGPHRTRHPQLHDTTSKDGI